jgi:DNA-binding transcriptional regulator GbsR (MarR family)
MPINIRVDQISFIRRFAPKSRREVVILQNERILSSGGLDLTSARYFSNFCHDRNEEPMAHLSTVKKQFVLHWGEMGARWGINRTVAQVHALLQVSAEPMTAEEIASTLSVARSNVSTSIRELQAWGLIRSAHVLGDRRQHFAAIKDVWEMFRIIVDERKKREIDPTMELLRQCIAELDKGNAVDSAHTRERLRELYEFFAAIDAIYTDVRKVPAGTLRGLIKARGAFRRLLSGRQAKPGQAAELT